MSGPVHASSRGGYPLSRAQAMMLQGVIPIVLVGFVLPIGLISSVLAIENMSIASAVDHGSLFLSAGNAAFIGCITLVSSRADQPVNTMIAAIVVFALIVAPAYLFWAIVTVRDMSEMEYSNFFVIGVGGAFSALAVVVALVFVWLSYRPPVISSKS